MANVGTVTFDVAAETAKLRQDLDKVKKDVGGLSATAKNFEKGLKTIGGVIAGVFSVGAVSSFVRHVNQAADRLNDVSQRLGVSASRLNVLELAATQAGASTEAVATAMAKLTETVGSAAMGNKAVAASIDTLGLSTKQLLALRPDQAFEAVTQALSQMPNEFQRAAIAQDLLGKGAKELSAFYREGETAIEAAQAALERHGALLSDIDVARIGVMNDDLDAQGTIIQNLGVKFLSNLTPAVSVATEAISDMIIEMGGAEQAGKDMGVVLVRVIKAIEIAANGIIIAFQTVRTVVAGVLALATKGIEKIMEANLALAEAIGFDRVAAGIRPQLELVSGLALSFKSVADSAADGTVAATERLKKATLDFMNAEEIFAQKAREMEERAAAAAGRPLSASELRMNPADRTSQIAPELGAVSAAGAGGLRVEGPNDFQFDQMTREIYASNLEALKEAGVLRQQEWDRQLNAMGVSLGNSIAYQTALEAAKYETWGGLAGEFVGVIGNSNNKMAKLQQNLALAQAVWWTASGVANALRSVPFPANIAAAAKVAVMGAIQIAKIKATKYGASGGGSFGTIGGGGEGGGQPAFQTPAAVAQQEPQRIAQVIIQGDVFSSQETANWIVEQLRQAVNDRDVVYIAPNSRQALELGST